MDSPLDDPKSYKMMILKKIDLFMTVAFTIEVVVKVIVYGFLFGKKTYLREAWNILDFLIVLTALIDLALGDSVSVGFLKAIRILKILRPLRLISRNKDLKISIISLGRAIPAILRLSLLVFFFIFLFAILMTMLFSGSFDSCNMDHLTLKKEQ